MQPSSCDCLSVTLKSARSPEVADWARREVARYSFGTVGSILPCDGFPATIRVLHPFQTAAGADVSWKVVGASIGFVVGAGTDSDDLIQALRESSPDGAEPGSPVPGRIPPEVARLIQGSLSEADVMGGRCYAAIWDGWPELQAESVDAPIVHWPARSWYLFEASLTGDGMPQPAGLTVPPSLWWPDDRSWFVATDVDHRCSYVCCSREDASHLLANSSLEAFRVDADAKAAG